MHTLKKEMLYKRNILLFLAFSYFLLHPFSITYAAKNFEPSGPVPVTNQTPLYIFFLNATPDMPQIQEKGKSDFDIRYTMANINVRQFSYPPARDVDRVELDMEIHKLDLVYTYGLNERLDIRLDAPYLIFWGGFLDSCVEFFEDILNVVAPSSRGDWGRNDYKYFVRYNRQTLIDTEDPENGFGDFISSLKYKLMDEQGLLPAISLRGSIKFPTGSESKFLGSGKFDYGFGVLAQKKIGRLFLFFNSDGIIIAKPDVFKPMAMDKYIISVFLGSEFFFTQKLSMTLQGGVASTPFPEVKLVTSLDHPPGHIGFGLNYKINKSATFKSGVIENVSSASADIMLYTGLDIKF